MGESVINATCHSRFDVMAAIASAGPAAVISIHSSGTSPIWGTSPWVLTLEFDDVVTAPPHPTSTPVRAFTTTDAREVARFVRSAIEVGRTRIIVHCDNGWSRSAAVAASLSKHYNGDDGWFHIHRWPNQLVYYRMLRALEGSSMSSRAYEVAQRQLVDRVGSRVAKAILDEIEDVVHGRVPPNGGRHNAIYPYREDWPSVVWGEISRLACVVLLQAWPGRQRPAYSKELADRRELEEWLLIVIDHFREERW